MKKVLGKISSVRLGFGGYQDCMFGLSLSFDLSDGSGIGSFINGGWTIDPMPGAKWTEADRSAQRAKLVGRLIELMGDAKVFEVQALKGIPVEVELQGDTFKDFRILKEVL